MSSNFKDLFISYGRRESLGFVARLHQKIKQLGYEAWFDKVNIPDGEDYAARINHGIESAHNFVYVMAPRALCSPYCLIELEYARFLGKRIIPINQMVISQTESKMLSEGDKHYLSSFYAARAIKAPLIETAQDVLDRSLALIGSTDWLDAKEHLSDDDCAALADWAQGYENYWHRHDDDWDYLCGVNLPQFGNNIDVLDNVVERIITVLERHCAYVQKHTEILGQALDWSRNQRVNRFLLVGKERQTAEEWLLTEFSAGEQAPCVANDLLCDFVCESRKNSENRMTDCFVCYASQDKAQRDRLVCGLSHYAITTWRHDADIQQGEDYELAIDKGIEGSDNILYLLSPESVLSKYCDRELTHALRYNKRIIPILLREAPKPDIPPAIRNLQHINLSCCETPQDYEHGLDTLLYVLHQEQEYYELHKQLLTQALKWTAEDQQDAFLLRGFNLDNAKTWLRLNLQREQHPPTPIHAEFITSSEAARGQLGTEVFISYSRKDSDFARQLNRALQESGKTTWFDQESISKGVDFEKEIYKGIDSANNFVFIISPDSVVSPYCESEVTYAIENGKRIITVLCRETNTKLLPKQLQIINWLDFVHTPFTTVFFELVQAIDLDREHAHQHTVLQQRASEWQEHQSSQDFLLNAIACGKAQTWLNEAQVGAKVPQPTPQQIDYIQASQTKLDQLSLKEKRRIAILSVLLVLAIMAGIFAVFKSIEAAKQAEIALLAEEQAEQERDNAIEAQWQAAQERDKALEAETIAEEERDKARANEIWAKSLVIKTYADEALANKQLNDAALLYAFALTHPSAKLDVSYASSAESALYETAMQLKKLKLLLRGHKSGVNSVCYSKDGQFLVSGSDDRSVRIWSLHTGQIHKVLKGHQNEVLQVACSSTDDRIASASAEP